MLSDLWRCKYLGEWVASLGAVVGGGGGQLWKPFHHLLISTLGLTCGKDPTCPSHAACLHGDGKS